MSVRVRAWAMLGLAVLVLAAFAPVVGNPFVVLDDPDYVTSNAVVKQGLTVAGVRWALTASDVSWYPLTWLSHMTDVEVWGLDPRGHHLTSLLIHVANALLLAGALGRLTGRWGLALAVSALFAVHPLRVESVAWIAERKDVLCAFFGLLAIWLYASWVQRGRWWRFLLLTLAFVASLAAKSMLVTLPFLLLLLDLWPLGRMTSWRAARRLLLEKTPLLAISAAASVAVFAGQHAAGAVSSISVIPSSVRLANAVVVLVRYLGKLFLPVGLSPWYSLVAYRPGVIGLSLLALAAITAAAVASVRSRPYVLVGWLWFCGLLIPVLGLVQIGRQGLADRYTYLPSIGVTVALVWGVSEALERWRPTTRRLAGLVLLGGALLAETALTIRQTELWRDSVTLFGHAVAIEPSSADCWRLLGVAVCAEQGPAAALPTLERAVALGPRDPLHRRTLAETLLAAGQRRRAANEYVETLRLLPGDPDASLALAWIRAADPDPGLRDGAGALTLVRAVSPGVAVHDWELFDAQAAALAELGRFEEAVAAAEAALAVAPSASRPQIEGRLAGYRRGEPFRAHGRSF